MTKTHKHKHRKHKSMMRRLDDSMKRPANFDDIMNRANQGWEMLAKDISRFRTLSPLSQILLVLILTGTILIIFSLIASLLTNLLPW
jgi:hypothetical protein